MSEKRNLDETDREIVRLLLEDARRPFSDIAERVDLSPPAVSDRVERLEKQGVIRRFTIDLDRTKLQDRRPILLKVQTVPGETDRVYETLAGLGDVEHVFKTYDGTVVAHVSAPEYDLDEWLHAAIDFESVTGYEVDLLDEHAWNATVGEAEFTLSCAVCDQTVTSNGVTAEIGGEVRAFCCPSCESRYREEYETRREQAQ